MKITHILCRQYFNLVDTFQPAIRRIFPNLVTYIDSTYQAIFFLKMQLNDILGLKKNKLRYHPHFFEDIIRKIFLNLKFLCLYSFEYQ